MVSNPTEFILGILIGGLVGVVFDRLLGARIDRAMAWLPRRLRSRDVARWEGPNREAVVVLQNWSTTSPLAETHVLETWEHLDVLDRDKPHDLPLASYAYLEHPETFLALRQSVIADIDAGRSAAASAGAPNQTASWVGSLAHFDPRWKETVDPRQETAHLRFRPVPYADTLAIAHYADQFPAERRRWQQALVDGREKLSHLPPATFWVSISVTSADGWLLVWRRSGNVHTARGQWSLGTDETMKPPRFLADGGATEGLFGLARRSLEEELGLVPANYGDHVHFSCLGVCRTDAPFPRLALGHVWTSLTTGEIEDRWLSCESAHEHADLSWIAPSRQVLQRVAAGHSVLDRDDRQVGPDWLYTSWWMAAGRWAVRAPGSNRI